ncbi:WAT1-related protein At5g13670-like [Vigna umbellata]|uniref:WAT1-related protein At5g13670-like n=1 Tax=Vigna umbellata TaxID=87088 RepID=UPI001F5EC26F|nr:WAT1-related protein At5g13670-like [Vigna umbellata]
MDDLNKVEGTGNVKAVLLMILLQTLYAVVNIMLKIVADDGMSLSILIAYRFIFASAFIVPLALIVERCWNMDDLNKVEGTGNVKAVLLMILLQTLYAVVNIMLKIVADDGMSLSILIAYRFIFASAFIVPLALIVERKHLQDVTGKVAFQGFLCGLFGGSLLQGLYVKSLALTSAVYVSAMMNLVPGVTYLMSISLGCRGRNIVWLVRQCPMINARLAHGGPHVWFIRGMVAAKYATVESLPY